MSDLYANEALIGDGLSAFYYDNMLWMFFIVLFFLLFLTGACYVKKKYTQTVLWGFLSGLFLIASGVFAVRGAALGGGFAIIYDMSVTDLVFLAFMSLMAGCAYVEKKRKMFVFWMLLLRLLFFSFLECAAGKAVQGF